MILSDIVPLAVTPGLTLLPAKMDTPAARVMLFAIGMQESGFAARLQAGGGLARGYWQFQQDGTAGVVGNAFTAPFLQGACGLLDIAFTAAAIYEAVAYCDTLACVLARLLLWSDPAPLPALGDSAGAYNVYDQNWRPGAPSAVRWASAYAAAMANAQG